MTFSKVNIVPDYANDIQVVGRVMNNSTQTLENVIIITEFYDRNNQLVNVIDAYPSLGILNPGDSTPFKATTSGTKTNIVGSIILGCGASVPSQFSPQRNSSAFTLP